MLKVQVIFCNELQNKMDKSNFTLVWYLYFVNSAILLNKNVFVP